MELSIDELNNLANNNDELMKRNEKLVNTLEEIRGTVQKGMYSLKKGYSREYQDTLSNIFNKINEVLQ